MNILVADVGGTNTRLAVATAKDGLQVQARFENDAFASFPALLGRYLRDRRLPGLAGCCIAIAGPVARGRARLTNRDWEFDPMAIAEELPDPLPRPVRLINDLAALGHALGGLPASGLRQVQDATDIAVDNGQAIVAGLGTGFNVCAVSAGPRPMVLQAELGHASLPLSVVSALRSEIGSVAAKFTTNEHVFSGPGLSRLHTAVSDGDDCPGPEILSRVGAGDATAVRTVRLSARVLGLLARELVFAYMPLGGIHFAGSVARGLLGSDQAQAFNEAFTEPGPFVDLTSRVPVRLITDDCAALIGAARAARF